MVYVFLSMRICQNQSLRQIQTHMDRTSNSWIFVCQEMFIDKRILYVKELVGVFMVLKRFQEQIKNKPYRSSLAHDLRFTSTLINEKYIDRKGWAA